MVSSFISSHVWLLLLSFLSSSVLSLLLHVVSSFISSHVLLLLLSLFSSSVLSLLLHVVSSFISSHVLLLLLSFLVSPLTCLFTCLASFLVFSRLSSFIFSFLLFIVFSFLFLSCFVSLSLSLSVSLCVSLSVLCGVCGVPVCTFKNTSVCTFKTPPCVPAPRPHVITHAGVVPVHTETFRTYTRGRFECTHGGGRGEGRAGHRQFCLPKFAHVRLSLDPRGSPKKPLVLTHSRSENRSRTTRSRVLQSFALPDEPVHFQQS